jgi:C_GCAxxG_C_C family probable redox protein
VSDHAELAKSLFIEGYNCSQAVFCAYCDVTGIEIDAAARMASSFGGGLGRLREVCGTVSGAALVLGIVRGYSDPKDYAAKKAHYALVQEFARRFREKNGSIVCRELLRGVETTLGGDPERRTAEYYRKRPCPNLAYCAAEILDEMLTETEP